VLFVDASLAFDGTFIFAPKGIVLGLDRKELMLDELELDALESSIDTSVEGAACLGVLPPMFEFLVSSRDFICLVSSKILS